MFHRAETDMILCNAEEEVTGQSIVVMTHPQRGSQLTKKQVLRPACLAVWLLRGCLATANFAFWQQLLAKPQ